MNAVRHRRIRCDERPLQSEFYLDTHSDLQLFIVKCSDCIILYDEHLLDRHSTFWFTIISNSLQLIFSGEYTKAMNKDWHSGHFCCWQCDDSLTGQRYVLRDEHPYCVRCYEQVFANTCDECSKPIGIDSKVSATHNFSLLDSFSRRPRELRSSAQIELDWAVSSNKNFTTSPSSFPIQPMRVSILCPIREVVASLRMRDWIVPSRSANLFSLTRLDSWRARLLETTFKSGTNEERQQNNRAGESTRVALCMTEYESGKRVSRESISPWKRRTKTPLPNQEVFIMCGVVDRLVRGDYPTFRSSAVSISSRFVFRKKRDNESTDRRLPFNSHPVISPDS